jgi:hypothetical protein
VATITDIPTEAAPEAIVTYANARDVEILFDQGDTMVDDDHTCKDADSGDRYFTDAVIHVP